MDVPIPDIQPADREQYKTIFTRLNPKNGYLPGAELRKTLQKSNLQDFQLGRLWELSDVDKDGSLDLEEFMLMMHLIKFVKAGGEIPLKLPDNILPRKSVISPSVSLSSIESDRKTSVPDTGYSWVVDNVSLDRSRTNFVKLEPTGTGRIPGNVLKSYFLALCPDQSALIAVWNLSDTANQGSLSLEEFALAEWLIENRVKKGLPLPDKLLPNMIPPSCSPSSSQSSAPLKPPALPPRGMSPGGVLGPSIELMQYLQNPVLAPLAQELINLEKEKHEQLRAIEEKKAKQSRLAVDNERANLEIRQATVSARVAEEEATSAGVRLDQLEMEIRRFEDKIAQVQAECLKQSKEIEELGKSIRQNGQDVQQKQQDLKRAENELSQLMREEKTLEQKLNECREQLLNSELSSQEARLVEELNQLKAQLAARGIPYESKVSITNGSSFKDFGDPFANHDPFSISDAFDVKDPFSSHEDPFKASFGQFGSNFSSKDSKTAPERPPPPARPPPPGSKPKSFPVVASDPFGSAAVDPFSTPTNKPSEDPFAPNFSSVFPASTQPAPSTDPFGAPSGFGTPSQSLPFGTQPKKDPFSSADPFGAPPILSSDPFVAPQTSSDSKLPSAADPFSDPFGVPAFTNTTTTDAFGASSQPANFDAFSNVTSSVADPFAAPTSQENSTPASLESAKVSSSREAMKPFGSVYDEVYAFRGIENSSSDATNAVNVEGPKSLDWFLAGTTKEKSNPDTAASLLSKMGTSEQKLSGASKSVENMCNKWDFNMVPFTVDPFTTETNFQLSATNNLSSSNMAEVLSQTSNVSLPSDSPRSLSLADDVTKPSQSLDSDNRGSLPGIDPPEIQITSVPTVDQTASDYEPDDVDGAVATPTGDENSSPLEPSTPTEEEIPVIQRTDFEADSTEVAVKETEVKEDVLSKEVESTKTEVDSSLDGEGFVMVNQSDVNSNGSPGRDSEQGETKDTPPIRPSIELDESSTEHEYQVSPSNEQVPEDPFTMTTKSGTTPDNSFTQIPQVNANGVSNSHDFTSDLFATAEAAAEEVGFVSSNSTEQILPKDTASVDPFGPGPEASNDPFSAGESKPNLPVVSTGDDGFGDAFGTTELPTSMNVVPEFESGGFDDQFGN